MSIYIQYLDFPLQQKWQACYANNVYPLSAYLFVSPTTLFNPVIIYNPSTKYGKFRIWLIIGTLINSVVFVLLFYSFHLQGTSLYVYVSIMYIFIDNIFRTSSLKMLCTYISLRYIYYKCSPHYSVRNFYFQIKGTAYRN